MTDEQSIRELILNRQDLHIREAKASPGYAEVSERLDALYEQAEAVLDRLEQPDRVTVSRLIEGETERNGLDVNAVYLGGMADGVGMLLALMTRDFAELI